MLYIHKGQKPYTQVQSSNYTVQGCDLGKYVFYRSLMVWGIR